MINITLRTTIIFFIVITCIVSNMYASPRDLLVDPTHPIIVVQGDNILIDVDNRDNYIQKIVLLANRKYLSEYDGIGFYTFKWNTDGVIPGNYNLLIRGISNKNQMQQLAVYEVVVVSTNPVWIEAPAMEAELVTTLNMKLGNSAGYKAIDVKWELSDTKSTIASSSSSSEITELDITKYPPGKYLLMASVITNNGLAWTFPTTFLIPERIKISSPSSEQQIVLTDSNTTIPISVSVHKDIKIKKVEYFCDGNNIAIQDNQQADIKWNADKLNSGTHLIYAKLYDETDRVWQSEKASFSVFNEPLDKRLAIEAKKKAEIAAREAKKQAEIANKAAKLKAKEDAKKQAMINKYNKETVKTQYTNPEIERLFPQWVVIVENETQNMLERASIFDQMYQVLQTNGSSITMNILREQLQSNMDQMDIYIKIDKEIGGTLAYLVDHEMNPEYKQKYYNAMNVIRDKLLQVCNAQDIAMRKLVNLYK
jgi:hypothetical protein